MKTFLRPSNILFYFLSALVFFLIGLIFAGVAGAGKGQGLAGGAIILGYGVLAGGVAFIAAILAARSIGETRVVLFNKILGVLFAFFIAVSTYRFLTREESQAGPDRSVPRKTTAPAALAVPVSYQPALHRQYRPPMGLGMLKPAFYNSRVIYFYGNPNLKKPVSDHAPTDSLVFKRSERGVEIAHAPPWFVPVHLKLDYGVLFLRAVSVHSDFVDVIVNETNGRNAYLDRHKSELIYWPEFLLSINSVEPRSRQDKPIRVKPLSHAGHVSTQYAFLKPLQISNQWMQVELLDDSFNSHGQGWIKWQENGELLITYSLFS